MYERIVLSNGIRVIYEHIPYVKSVSAGVWVEAGSRHETTADNGLAHFLEHMLFKGTKTRSAQQIAEQMDYLGGHLNAYTSRECTCYYTKTLDEHLDKSLEMLSDMLINSLFDQRDIETERKVILEEIAMYEDSPEDLVHDLMALASWGQDSLALPISGTAASVGAVSRDSMLEYYKNNYTCQRIVIALAGNFDIASLPSILESYFSGFCAKGEVTVRNVPALTYESIVRTKEIEQTHMALCLNGVGQESEEIFAIALLSNILAGSMSSRLFQEVREKRGLAYSIYSTPECFKGTGVFSIYAGLSPENTDKVLEIIINQLEKLRKGGVTDIELDRGREQLKSAYIMGLESVSSRMNSIGKSELLFGRVRTAQEIIESINKIEHHHMDALIEKIITPDKYAIAMVTPKS